MKTANLHVRISAELRDEFYKIAEENMQVPSVIIRKMIEEYIKNHKEEIQS